MVVAYTASAAFNVRGQTIHTFLRLNNRSTDDLEHSESRKPSGSNISNLQRDLKGLRFLVIDEFSVIDPTLLRLMDEKLRLVFPCCSIWQFLPNTSILSFRIVQKGRLWSCEREMVSVQPGRRTNATTTTNWSKRTTVCSCASQSSSRECYGRRHKII